MNEVIDLIAKFCHSPQPEHSRRHAHNTGPIEIEGVTKEQLPFDLPDVFKSIVHIEIIIHKHSGESFCVDLESPVALISSTRTPYLGMKNSREKVKDKQLEDKHEKVDR